MMSLQRDWDTLVGIQRKMNTIKGGKSQSKIAAVFFRQKRKPGKKFRVW